jgi:small GTP-binding protein
MIDKKSIQNQIDNELEKVKKNIKKPNVFIVGGTGVGKSSLINTIFGEKVASISNGKPETRGIIKYSLENINLFDTEGLELNEKNEEKFNTEVLGYIENKKTEKQENQIHLIWYLISASSDRITDYQTKIFNDLKKFNIPVAVVFTKCDLATEIGVEKMIQCLYPSMTYKKSFEEDKINPPFFTSNNIDEELNPKHLIDWSISKLPEVLQEGFISAQILNYEAKYNKAKNIILQHTSGNALVGFTPIPFSDAPVLIMSQIGMLSRIISLYDIKAFDLKSFMATTGTGLIISNFGKSAVASLLKFIPVIGTVAGGIINAGVAGAITFAMGTSLNVILNKLYINILKDNQENINFILSNFDQIFSDEFNQQFKKKSNE